MAGTTMGLAEPLGEFVQLVGESTQVSCKIQPGVFGVHEMVALPGVAGTMVKVGAPPVWMAVGKTQNPPVTEYWPLVIGPPASGWPIVPLMEYTPPVLVPPPPSMVDQSMEYD